MREDRPHGTSQFFPWFGLAKIEKKKQTNNGGPRRLNIALLRGNVTKIEQHQSLQQVQALSTASASC